MNLRVLLPIFGTIIMVCLLACTRFVSAVPSPPPDNTEAQRVVIYEYLRDLGKSHEYAESYSIAFVFGTSGGKSDTEAAEFAKTIADSAVGEESAQAPSGLAATDGQATQPIQSPPSAESADGPTVPRRNNPVRVAIPSEHPPGLITSKELSERGIDVGQLESLIHQALNSRRSRRGLSPLERDDRLAALAKEHSVDMALTGFFRHVNPKGLDPTDRADRAGYSCVKDYGAFYTEGVAENILYTSVYSSTVVNYRLFGAVKSERYNWHSQSELVSEIVESWMNSPGHRGNILDRTYDRAGLGVAITSEGKVYVTQNFC